MKRMCIPLFVFLAATGSLGAKEKRPLPPVAPAGDIPALAESGEGRALDAALAAANFQLTPAVKAAYLQYAKAQALREINAAGKSLPEDFLAWIDSDPEVQATVYGARLKAENVLLMLRSLDIDLGSDNVRHKYTQLALAMAVAEAAQGPSANITPRPPMKLSILHDPRQWVDTKPADRPLDVNDHIINFLEDHPPVDADTFGPHEAPLVLTRDSNGAEMLAGTKTAKGETAVKRPLVAADVIESKQLQDEFNAYMAAHGQSARIDCGDHAITPNQHAAIKGPYAKGILAAYNLFRTAYEAKGRLPRGRDPLATPAERCAFLIQNDGYRFPEDTAAQRQWPRYPLTAPWPTLTLLAEDTQPLRERNEAWTRFVDKGEVIGYGEYIGDIAQQFNFQSARRLSPYPFSYGTLQMMMKDGGVCGTMANMAVRTQIALGIPACTAGQPGHCALIHFTYDPATGAYLCKGGQYVTAGDAGTYPHANWVFGDTDAHRDMVWHQSVGWGVNAGVQSYLDSMLALDIYRVLPPGEREAHGLAILESGLKLNPYNFALVEAGQAAAANESDEMAFDQAFKTLFAGRTDMPGCPANGLYNKTEQQMFERRIAKMKPATKDEAARTLAYLRQEGLANGGAVAVQSMDVDGLPAVMEQTRGSFASYLASDRTGEESAAMAETIETVGRAIGNKKQCTGWASGLGSLVANREYYFDSRNHVVYDKAVAQLVKLAGYTKQPEEVAYGALRRQLSASLAASVNGTRDISSCRKLAARIGSLGKVTADAAARIAWQQELQKIMAGKEHFVPAGAKPGAKPATDPCVAAIAKLV